MQIGFADHYLSKYRCNYFIEPAMYLPFDMVIVIPCYDEPEIGKTIQSLFQCKLDAIRIAIVVVINSTVVTPLEIKNQNRKTATELDALKNGCKKGMQLVVIHVEDLPAKQGGVGWARKIGMDWAIAQFNHFGFSNGIIVSLDADTLVEPNYLNSIYSYFKQNPEKVGATIYFEHPITVDDKRDNKTDQAIVYYELYMRYFRNSLLATGFPSSIYTVGSCFAVKASAYIAQGGMNRRKAGEDFYFLHKLVIFGEIGEINSTTVYPSPRKSNRVPFGTGTVIQKYCEGDRSLELTYPFSSFLTLKPFFAAAPYFYDLGNKLSTEDLSSEKEFRAFADENNITKGIQELVANCSSLSVFTRRFYHFFNAFMVLKWLNYSAINCSPREALLDECRKLLIYNRDNNNNIPNDTKLMLNLFRQIDKDRTNH